MWFFSSRKARRTTTKPSHRPTFRPRVRALEDRCLMSAGMLDPTFNPAGCPQASPPTAAGTAVALTNNTSYAYGAILQPSGKLVLVGTTIVNANGPQATLAEFDPNGSLDSNFGSHGIVTNSKWTIAYGTQGCLAVLYPTGSSGDQKILVVGPSTTGTFTLARYNSDGSLDTSFGNKGIVNTSFTQGTGSVTGPLDGVVLVPNGTSPPKIIMAGSDANNAGIEMARYNPNGSLDTSFGSGGKVYTPISGGMQVDAVALDPVSSDILVAGSQLVAFKPNGSLDTAFGTNGIVNAGGRLAVYPAGDPGGNAGKILVSSGNADTRSVVRLSPSGVLDTSWGGTGVVTTPAVSGGTPSVAIQADDKVVQADWGWNVARLNADGSLDTSFGSGGMASPGFRSSLWWSPVAVVFEPNGDIIEAGSANAVTNNTIHSVFAVARLLPSEPEIGSFTANQVTAGAPVTLTASNLTDGNPNSTISQVTFFYYDSNGNKIVVGTATAPDGSGNWTVSVSLPPGSYTLYAQATDSYGVLGDPLAYSLTVQ